MHKSPRLSLQSALLTLTLTLTLMSCATQTQTRATDPAPTAPPPLCATAAPPPPPTPSACVAFPRLNYSRLHDTDQTIREIRAYDAARDALCGKGK